ncbi:MAG: RnfABCDGE type electron transport complex subunit D [Candidatus Eisenbacteria sp.]|nr:RnfABCDGE type electron transport complex subunit D [Candidatus Eisenbacteria bacterium]
MAAEEKRGTRLFMVESSPHVGGDLTTPRVMLDVLIALAPATLVALWFFKMYAVVLVVSCVAGAAFAEVLANRLMHRSNSLGDLSAVVTGIILAFCLPPNFPFYFAFMGGAVSTGIGKMVFGGLGANIFNPAMVGRAFLTACFGTMMTTWTVPGTTQVIGSPEAIEYGVAHGLEAITQATPMGLVKQVLKSGGDDPEKLKTLVALMPRMCLGSVGGSLGETSAIAILLGGGWMLLRRTITWHIPVGVVLGALAFALPAWLVSPAAVPNPGIHILGGAMLFGAFIIATDPVTCPLSAKGRLIFGVGVGILTMLIRILGGYPEGVMYAVLLMNALTPFLDQWTKAKPLGLEGNSNA